MWPTSDMFMLFFVFSDICDPQVKMQYYKFLFHTNSRSVTISNLFVNSKFNPFNWLEQPLNSLSINFQATTQNIVAHFHWPGHVHGDLLVVPYFQHLASLSAQWLHLFLFEVEVQGYLFVLEAFFYPVINTFYY